MSDKNHPDDQLRIERLHADFIHRFDRVNDDLMQFQDTAYAMGRARGIQEAAVAWISVKDRIATAEDGTVAVMFDDGQPGVAWATYWHGARTDFAQWTFPLDDLADGREVTHWMPLPKRPE